MRKGQIRHRNISINSRTRAVTPCTSLTSSGLTRHPRVVGRLPELFLLQLRRRGPLEAAVIISRVAAFVVELWEEAVTEIINRKEGKVGHRIWPEGATAVEEGVAPTAEKIPITTHPISNIRVSRTINRRNIVEVVVAVVAAAAVVTAKAIVITRITALATAVLTAFTTHTEVTKEALIRNLDPCMVNTILSSSNNNSSSRREMGLDLVQPQMLH